MKIIGRMGLVKELDKYQKKELLYRGLLGREVHRVYRGSEESYILKPFLPTSHEVWVYENVLPAIPPVYPKLLESSLLPTPIDQSEEGWLLFEDLGHIQHAFREDWALEAVRLTAGWHALPPASLLQAPVSGQKPSYAAMVTDLQHLKHEQLCLEGCDGIESSHLYQLLHLAAREELSSTQVISHGDLHVGNYTYARGQIYILDWEHAHLNYPYWDLYHIIDLSHPLYVKKLSREWRGLLLDRYIQEAVHLGSSLKPSRFRYEYHLFSSIFSLWMLQLIAADQAQSNSPWSEEQLIRQAIETTQAFKETMLYLSLSS